MPRSPLYDRQPADEHGFDDKVRDAEPRDRVPERDDAVEQVEGFGCFVLGGTTTDSFWRRTPGGTAILRCIGDV